MSKDLIQSVSHSNLSFEQKSRLTDLLNEISTPIAPLAPLPSRGDMLLSSIQSSVVGGGLGLLHAELKEGLDVNGIPIDLALAVVSKIGALVYRSERSNSISDQAMTVYSFRQVESTLSAIKERRAEQAKAANSQNAQAAE
jgi:hypothetical protein